MQLNHLSLHQAGAKAQAGTHSFNEDARTRSSERRSVSVMESRAISTVALPFSRVVRASFRLSRVFCISAVCMQHWSDVSGGMFAKGMHTTSSYALELSQQLLWVLPIRYAVRDHESIKSLKVVPKATTYITSE